MSEEKYDYWSDPEYQPMPDMSAVGRSTRRCFSDFSSPTRTRTYHPRSA